MKFKLYIASTEYTHDTEIEADTLEEAKEKMLELWNQGLLETTDSEEEVLESFN